MKKKPWWSTHKARIACFFPLLCLMPMAAASAETPEEKGLAIATEARQRETGYQDSVSELTMILRNRNGQESQRELRIKVLEVADDGDKSLVIFDSPKDVKGTALLSFAHKTQDDDQWLYLPAIKRVKRIASGNKSGPFMGSEFAYEDMSSQEVEKFTYKYLREEVLDGTDCFVIERYPADKKSGYTKQVAWLDKAEYRLQKVDYYDRKSELLKTLTAKNHQQYLDKYWRPETMEMVNHQTGKGTTLQWKNHQFGNGFTGRDFDVNSLQRAR